MKLTSDMTGWSYMSGIKNKIILNLPPFSTYSIDRRENIGKGYSFWQREEKSLLTPGTPHLICAI